MPSPDALAAALRAHARGLRCPEAATGLLIAQSWLYREDFTSQFVRTRHDATCGQQAATIDWPAVVTALGTSLPAPLPDLAHSRLAAHARQRTLKISPDGHGKTPSSPAGSGSARCPHPPDQHEPSQRQERRHDPARSEPVCTRAPPGCVTQPSPPAKQTPQPKPGSDTISKRTSSPLND
jgi:hypothetical protein